MPLEKTIERAIRKAANAKGWWIIKMHGGPMSRAGLPDLLCIRNGDVRWIEVKRSNTAGATPLQAETIRRLTMGGTPARVCHSAEEAMEFLCSSAAACLAGRDRMATDPAIKTMERRRMEVRRGGFDSSGSGRFQAGDRRRKTGLPPAVPAGGRRVLADGRGGV
jgi:hypothetical protein